MRPPQIYLLPTNFFESSVRLYSLVLRHRYLPIHPANPPLVDKAIATLSWDTALPVSLEAVVPSMMEVSRTHFPLWLLPLFPPSGGFLLSF